MDKFYRDHNFNKDEKILQHNFWVVRYYPKIQTQEFINVGIILCKSGKHRLMSEYETAGLHYPLFIDKIVLNNAISSFDARLTAKTRPLVESIERQTNILLISPMLVYASQLSAKDVLDKLFYDYVGYKFINKRKLK